MAAIKWFQDCGIVAWPLLVFSIVALALTKRTDCVLVSLSSVSNAECLETL